MKTYIGTKTIRAKEMSRAEYNILRGWALPSDERGDDQGYLVEYLNGSKPNHPNYEGYISWSPRAVFEEAYKLVGDDMSFCQALAALRVGKKVARKEWTKHEWIEMQINFANDKPYIERRNQKFDYVQTWAASSDDLLANDWRIVE